MKNHLDERQLLALKKKIEDAKITVSELTGTQKSQMQQLKNDFNCNSVKEAEAKKEKIADEIEELETSIEEGLKELEELYDE